MENFLLTLNILAPIFLVMGLGYLSRRLNLLKDDAVKTMNNVVFRVFIPIMIAENIISAEKNFDSGPKLFIFVAISVFVVFGLAWLIIPHLEKDDKKRSVLIQGIGRSNYVLFGLPLVKSMCPDGNYAIAAFLIIIAIPLFNILSVIVLEVYRGGKASFRKIFLSILKNPLIIGSLIAFVLMNIPIPYPAFLTKAVSDVGDMASPLAIFLLGASFEFRKVRHNIRPLLIGVIGKLVAVPLLLLPAAYLLGLRDAEFASVLVLAGSPSAVNSFTMAQQMGADGELAGEQVVVSSVFSSITLFCIIFACKQLGII